MRLLPSGYTVGHIGPEIESMPTVWIVARTALRESLRTRFWLIYALAILLCLGAALFIGQLALTGTMRSRIITFAAFIRPLLAAQLVLHVAASISRETQEKGLDMILAAGLPAPALIIGRMLGYGLIGAIMTAGAALTLMVLGASMQLGIWAAGLACELGLLAGFTLAAAITLRQVASSALASAVFYLLGHSLNSIVLLARHSIAGPAQTLSWPVEAIAWLMPRFDLFGSADWLVGLRSGQLSPIALQTPIYLCILFAIAALDLKRNREPS